MTTSNRLQSTCVQLAAAALVAALSGVACQTTTPPPAEKSLEAAPAPDPVVLKGDPKAGESFWHAGTTFCGECHGRSAEGAYGPDLAGRGLSFEQFRRQVRQPWGAMPRWTEEQIDDQTLADVHAYLTSLPKVDEPGKWSVTVPKNAPLALRYFTESYGCAQCHGTDMEAALTGADHPKMDFDWFATRVYTHDTVFPKGRMGSYSKIRLPESVLKAMWESALEQQRARLEREAREAKRSTSASAPATAAGQ